MNYNPSIKEEGIIQPYKTKLTLIGGVDSDRRAIPIALDSEGNLNISLKEGSRLEELNLNAQLISMPTSVWRNVGDVFETQGFPNATVVLDVVIGDAVVPFNMRAILKRALPTTHEVTGATYPAVNGFYNQTGTFRNKPYYENIAGTFNIWWDGLDSWIISATPGILPLDYFKLTQVSMVGTYTGIGSAVGAAIVSRSDLEATGATTPAAANDYYGETGFYNNSVYYSDADGTYFIWWDGFSTWYITPVLGESHSTSGVTTPVTAGNWSGAGIYNSHIYYMHKSLAYYMWADANPATVWTISTVLGTPGAARWTNADPSPLGNGGVFTAEGTAVGNATLAYSNCFSLAATSNLGSYTARGPAYAGTVVVGGMDFQLYGVISPDVVGFYRAGGTEATKTYYELADESSFIWWSASIDAGSWIISGTVGTEGSDYFKLNTTSPIGTYTAVGTNTGAPILRNASFDFPEIGVDAKTPYAYGGRVIQLYNDSDYTSGMYAQIVLAGFPYCQIQCKFNGTTSAILSAWVYLTA